MSRQCAAGRHAGAYAPALDRDGRVVGDQFQPPCSGCECPCHQGAVKLT